MKIEVNGASDLIADFLKYGEELDDDIAEVVVETAYKVQANAKLNAPVETGHLKRNIKVDISPDKKKASVYVDKEDVEYVEPVEFGTRYQHAQPFLYPAGEQEQNEFDAKIIRKVNERA